MRIRLAALLSALLFGVFGVLLSASAADAATAARPASSQVAVQHASNGTAMYREMLQRSDIRPYTWYIYSTYPSRAECRSQGNFLLSMGLITDYYCSAVGNGWYTLHVNTEVTPSP